MVAQTPAPFVIIGMMALFGGIAHAPLAVMLMVAEMTGNLSLLAPAMVAVAVSTALVGDETIYRSQVLDRSHSPAHRWRFSFPLLSSLLVRDAYQPTPVRDQATLSTDQAQWSVADHEPLDQALERLTESGLAALPVVSDGQVIGSISTRDIILCYRSALNQPLRRLRALPPSATLLELRLDEASPLAGRTLREANLPSESLVVAITRDGEALFPRAATRLEPGDIVAILTTPQREQEIRTYLQRPEGPNGPVSRPVPHTSQ